MHLFSLSRDKQHPYIILVFLFIIAFPFYIFKSGNPQPADLILVVLLLLFLQNKRYLLINTSSKRAISWLLNYVFYTALVNFSWGFISDHFSFISSIRYSTYYLYNSLLFIIYTLLYFKFGKTLLISTLWAAFLSVLLQIILSPFSGRELVRQTLFFNNPNQLGYYSILCASLFMVATPKLKIATWIQLIFYLSTAYMAFISVSKAALVSITLIIIYSFQRDFKMLLITLIIGVFVVFAIPSNLSKISKWSEPFIANATRVGASDSLEGRAYDRIWRYPQYLVFGAGEGGFTRFEGHPHEMHSAPGTLLFCYGFIGSFIFLRFLFLVIKNNLFLNFLYLTPVFAYSLTHQALRFSLLWILLAFILCLDHYTYYENKQRKAD